MMQTLSKIFWLSVFIVLRNNNSSLKINFSIALGKTYRAELSPKTLRISDYITIVFSFLYREPFDKVGLSRILSHLIPEYRNNILGQKTEPVASQVQTASSQTEGTDSKYGPVVLHRPGLTSQNDKRRELEMDLDNGDASDYLRLPY